MAITPKLDKVKRGDIFISDINFENGDPVFFISTVVDVGPIEGSDRMLVVQIQNHEGRYAEYEGKTLSYNQLANGMVR